MTDASLPEGLRRDVTALLDDAGIRSDRALVARMLQTGLMLGIEHTDRLDLKIASAALSEMRDAFRLFRPFHDVPKVTVFGSARTRHDDPLYLQARDVAAALAADGWMVVTGAGPGIMQAAAEGAGAQMSLGVSIRLPFEEKANSIVAENAQVVSMKYFFTRKLMLMKESRGFICLPGGFGTLDEMFELLTLQQTGKAEPMPIVLLDAPGGGFWEGLRRFVQEQMVPAGVISPDDLDRVLVTDSVERAVAEVTGFWRNYDSLRWVGDQLVLRLVHEPTDADIAALNERFADMLADGSIARSGPLPVERSDGDAVELPRLVLTLKQRAVGSLHTLIRAINELPSAR
ncbi:MULTISPECIES: TIGR00730 family Rossman fold protein [Microbacterium]|uniref:LOG family protein n=1 Tax=Microbacterium TaxID=33882 RepID=UPI00217DFDB4|nr:MULTISPECIES: TIGR00730 family Rossman fold protein [Microbacterium]UWF78304.1 TIGR00730 family Rossman fold protein [Microbacterium neungamense]WCM56480.1 TIGR00730 family Rossman fold protein [Microbacterium sp. EF45047]